MRVPLIILSDNPRGITGLGGRITRELTTRIHERLNNVFGVSVIGVGSGGVHEVNYRVDQVKLTKQYAVNELPYIMEERAAECGARVSDCVLLTIMNAGWQDWLVNPQTLPFGELRRFLTKNQFRKWAYLPIDAENPAGKLGRFEAAIIEKFDRRLAYTEWGADILNQTLGGKHEWCPHGLEIDEFYPRAREAARESFVRRILKSDAGRIAPSTLMIGCVATNTARKDWPLAFATCRDLVRQGKDVGFWGHTNKLFGNWNLLELAEIYDLKDRAVFSMGTLSNDDMAWGYSALDCVLCIGSGEGWGLTGAESLACGIPCVHGNYAGQPQFMPQEFLVDPAAYRVDGFYSSMRPVFDEEDWADAVLDIIGRPASLDPAYAWDGEFGAWVKWEKWLRAGVIR